MCCKVLKGYTVTMPGANEFGDTYVHHFIEREKAVEFLGRAGFVDWTVIPGNPRHAHFIREVYQKGLPVERQKDSFYKVETPSVIAYVEKIVFLDEGRENV